MRTAAERTDHQRQGKITASRQGALTGRPGSALLDSAKDYACRYRAGRLKPLQDPRILCVQSGAYPSEVWKAKFK